jgi:hypothetical protein
MRELRYSGLQSHLNLTNLRTLFFSVYTFILSLSVFFRFSVQLNLTNMGPVLTF